MRVLAMAASGIGLGLTLVPSVFVFAGALTWETHAVLMLAGTIVWFATAGRWIR